MRIFNLPLLIFLLVLPTAALARPPFNTSQPPCDPYSDNSSACINQTSTAIFAILGLPVLLICFVFIYFRFCSDDSVLPLYSSSSADAARPRRLSPIGLDQAAIDSFPVFNYSEIKHLKIGKGELTCAVCVSEFEDNERLRLLPKCDHVFHPECIDPWLASHSTCPICRAILSEKIESTQSTEVCNSSTAEISEVQNHDQIAIAVDENERVDTDSRERVRTLPRPHSTGHSLVRLGEDCEIYTLRLPEEVRRRHVDRLDRLGKSDRWVFNMTVSFLSRTGSVKLMELDVVDGEATDVGTSREFRTSMKSPFECLASKSEKMPTRLPV